MSFTDYEKEQLRLRGIDIEPAEDVVERVARAICRAEHLEHGEDQEAEAWRMLHERFEYLAKAAFSAMPDNTALIRQLVEKLTKYIEDVKAAHRDYSAYQRGIRDMGDIVIDWLANGSNYVTAGQTYLQKQ